MGSMYTMVSESAIRKSEAMPRSGTGKKVETITASEGREIGSNKEKYDVTCRWNLIMVTQAFLEPR